MTGIVRDGIQVPGKIATGMSQVAARIIPLPLSSDAIDCQPQSKMEVMVDTIGANDLSKRMAGMRECSLRINEGRFEIIVFKTKQGYGQY